MDRLAPFVVFAVWRAGCGSDVEATAECQDANRRVEVLVGTPNVSAARR